MWVWGAERPIPEHSSYVLRSAKQLADIIKKVRCHAAIVLEPWSRQWKPNRVGWTHPQLRVHRL
jgi:hypothetical protein